MFAPQPEHIPTWDEVRETLRGLLGEAFTRWFEPVTASIEEAQDGAPVLHLIVPSQFQRDWIRDNYSSTVETVWRGLAPGGMVMFTVKETPTETLAQKKLPAKILQFPLFPNEARPVSNDMARSALFSCVQGKDRQMVKDALLASQDGIEIRFTGERLNQDDHDLLMQLVEYAKHKPLGEYTTVPAYSILKALGGKKGGSHYQQLRADILRLFAASVSVRDSERKIEYFGHLIDEAAQDESSRYWTFKFNPKLRALYDDDMYTLIDWEQRKQLKGKDLARWLQLYIASHATPFPISVAYLRDKSGSQASVLWKFRQLLKTALDDLKADHLKIIEDWFIDDNDLVHIDRGKTISDSQQRHLSRAKRGRRPKK